MNIVCNNIKLSSPLLSPRYAQLPTCYHREESSIYARKLIQSVTSHHATSSALSVDELDALLQWYKVPSMYLSVCFLFLKLTSYIGLTTTTTWRALELHLQDEVIHENAGLWLDICGNQCLVLLRYVLIHPDNGGTLRTFVVVSHCKKVEQPLLPYPFNVYLPEPPFQSFPSLFHVAQISASAHLPHACLFGSIPPLHLARCVREHKSLNHDLRGNPYFVLNKFVVPRE